MNAFLRHLGERTGVTIVRRQARSYDELGKHVREGAIDVAWLPPILFARLEEDGIVEPVVCAERGGRDAYLSLLVSRRGGDVRMLGDLRGCRVGWVDPLSATGYVVPRMRLQGRFPLSEPLFAQEMFFGSHAAVARAVVDGVVDVGATYGGLAPDGTLDRGPFLEAGVSREDLHIVEAFGAIPPDVIAAHKRVGSSTTVLLATAFEAVSREPEVLAHVQVLFGALAFVRRPLVGYDALRSEIENAVDSGVIPAAAAFLSTRPPRSI